MDGGSGPLVSGDDCCEAIIEVGDQPNHLWRSMVVGQRERDKVMMNTAKRVGQVQPADTERLTSLLSLPEDGKELQVMLQTARHAINEGLLGGCVQEVVAHCERQPSSLHQAGEDLAYTRCQGDGAEVGRVGGVIGCLLLAQQVHYANLPCRGDGLGGPAAVKHVQQCGQQGGTPLDDGVGDLVTRAGGR